MHGPAGVPGGVVGRFCEARKGRDGRFVGAILKAALRGCARNIDPSNKCFPTLDLDVGRTLTFALRSNVLGAPRLPIGGIGRTDRKEARR